MDEQLDFLDVIFKTCITFCSMSRVAVVNPRYRKIVKDYMNGEDTKESFEKLDMTYDEVCEAVLLERDRINSAINFAPMVYAYSLDEYNNSSIISKYYNGELTKEEVINQVENFLNEAIPEKD